MGSWNATCNISNLPICCGDKVRVLFLNKGPYSLDMPDNAKEFNEYNSREGVYHNSFWIPRMVPFKAIYSDSGEVQGIEQSLITDYFWRQLETDLVPVDKGENQYHDPSMTLEHVKEKSFEQVFWASGEGRLRINSRYTDYVMDETITDIKKQFAARKPAPPVANPCTHVFILEDVWQSMLSLPIQAEAYNRGSYKREVHPTWFAYRQASFVENLAKSIETIKGLSEERKELRDIYLNLDRIFPQALTVPFMQGIKYYYDCLVSDIASDKLDLEKDHKMIYETIDRIAEICAIDDIFDVTRKTWTLQSGCGSQTTNYKETAMFHKAMADVGFKQARALELEQQEWEEEDLLSATEAEKETNE